MRLQARLRDAQAAQAVLDQLPATSSAENLVEEPNWSPSVDTTASFVKADPVPESTPDSTLDNVLSKDWEKGNRVKEKPTSQQCGIGSTAAVRSGCFRARTQELE